MTGREYRLRKRAEGQDATRERIVEATLALHREQGVAATSYVQIADLAGVGAATVYRHFPTLGSLVTACGSAVWDEIQPPVPENAPAVFAGQQHGRPRLEQLVAELDLFYARAAGYLQIAARDRDRIPELDHFLRQVDTGVTALVREALAPETPEEAVRLVAALADISVWQSLKLNAPSAPIREILRRLLECAVAIATQVPGGPVSAKGKTR